MSRPATLCRVILDYQAREIVVPLALKKDGEPQERDVKHIFMLYPQAMMIKVFNGVDAHTYTREAEAPEPGSPMNG